MWLVVGSNSELFWLVPRRGDVGVAGSTSRSRNDGSGQKSRNYEYELSVQDTKRAKLPDRHKGLSGNNCYILHLIFGPSLTGFQSSNPQRSPATPAVLLNQPGQILHKSGRDHL